MTSKIKKQSKINQLKDVFIEGGTKSCGKAHSKKEAIKVAYKFFPPDIQKQIPIEGVKATEFDSCYIVL